jgi:hypothetical protein
LSREKRGEEDEDEEKSEEEEEAEEENKALSTEKRMVLKRVSTSTESKRTARQVRLRA